MQPTPGSQPKFSQAADPPGLAPDVFHLRLFTGSQQLQRQ